MDKASSSQLQETQPLLKCSRFPLLGEHTTTVCSTSCKYELEQIQIGYFYHLNHQNLPVGSPVHLRSILLVMVTSKTESKVSVQFPSFSSLSTYFRRVFQNEKQGTIPPPKLDEEFLMESETATKVLARQILPCEFSKEKTLESFWFVEPGGVRQRTSGPQKKRKAGAGGGGPGKKKQTGPPGGGPGAPPGPGAPGGVGGVVAPGPGTGKSYYIAVLQWGRAVRETYNKNDLGHIERITTHGVWPYKMKTKQKHAVIFDKTFQNRNDLMDRAHFIWPNVLNHQWASINPKFPYIQAKSKKDTQSFQTLRKHNIDLWERQWEKHGRWGHLNNNTLYMEYCLNVLEPILNKLNDDGGGFMKFCGEKDEKGSRMLKMKQDEFLDFVGATSKLDVTFHSYEHESRHQLNEIRLYFSPTFPPVKYSNHNKKSSYEIPLYLR